MEPFIMIYTTRRHEAVDNTMQCKSEVDPSPKAYLSRHCVKPMMNRSSRNGSARLSRCATMSQHVSRDVPKFLAKSNNSA